MPLSDHGKILLLQQEIEKLEEALNRYPENSAGYTQEEIDEMVSIKEDISEHPDFVEIATDWYERHNWLIDKDEFEKLKERLKIADEYAEGVGIRWSEKLGNYYNFMTYNYFEDQEDN